MDEQSGQSYILLEDLLPLGVRFGHTTEPLTPDLSHDAAWREYSRHTAYTFHWMLCQPEWQPEAVCLANSERAFAAIRDHDSLAAWPA